MTSAGAAARSNSGGLSIGAVLARLKQEFPDLTISKIRFLESEELVTPQRTGSGYRQFSSADVERLRYILTAQRDHYLPLKVIKEQLDALDHGVPSALPVGGTLPRSLAVAFGGQAGGGAAFGGAVLGDGSRNGAAQRVRRSALSRAALCDETGLSVQQLGQAEEFGLVTADASGHYDDDAVLAARTVAELLALGLEPRHLRTLRTTAEREAAIVSQLVTSTSHRRDSGARQRASVDAAAHAATLLRLHALLLKSALERDLST